VTLPVGVEVSGLSKQVGLIDVAYAIPLAFLLGLVAAIMARRARRNLHWLQVREGGTGIASAAVIVSTVALCVAVTAALSVGFYELFLHHLTPFTR
jgi:hypothetical protein